MLIWQCANRGREDCAVSRVCVGMVDGRATAADGIGIVAAAVVGDSTGNAAATVAAVVAADVAQEDEASDVARVVVAADVAAAAAEPFPSVA